MPLEKMKVIKDFENYVISSWGNVYRIKQIVFFDEPHGKYISRTFSKLKPEETKKGYLRVYLYNNDGYRKHFKVHRLVAQAFIENPDGKPQVNHKDGNKHNNSVTNLEWVTDAENKKHRKEITS